MDLLSAARDEIWIVEYDGKLNVARCTDAIGNNWLVLGYKGPISNRTDGFRAVRKLDISALLDAPPAGPPIDIKSLSDKELVDLTLAKTPLAEARRQFSYSYAVIQQAEEQARAPDIYRIRRMEFEAAQKIAKAVGVVI